MAASAKVVFNGRKKYIANITGTFGGADETDTVVVDKSTLTGMDGTEPTSLRVDQIWWSINKYDAIQLEWDKAASDELIENLQGQGFLDFTREGGKNMIAGAGTGDIVLTSVGGVANGTFSIYLHCTKKD
jgi:hypothetical protein